MSTITFEQLEKDLKKVALASAQSGETVLVTQAGQPLIKIMPAVPPTRKAAALPNREEEIRKLPMTDSDRILEEFKAEREL